jgi:hypothetical protein
MRLLPPPSVLPAPGENQRRGLHNPTSVQEGTTSTCRGMHCGATCSSGPGTHHTSPIVASSHPQHANTYGVVIQHTEKVIFAPENCSRESIRILPKSLILAPPLATPPPPPRRDEARTQDRIAISDGAEEDQTRTQGQQERDNISYDTLPETANFPVSDGYVSFMHTF